MMRHKDNPSYFAIIPANVRYDKRIPAGAKLLYGEVTALSNQKGYCFASNGYFSDLYGCTPQAISKWFKQLEKAGHVSISYHETGGQTERRVSISVDRYQPRLSEVSTTVEGVSTTVEHNNTSILIQEDKRENAPAKKTDEPLFVTCKNHIIEQLKGEYANILRGARQRSKYSGPVSDIIEDYCRNIAEGQIEGKGDFHLMPPTDEGKHYTWINRMMAGIERYMKHAARREAGNKPTIKAAHTPQPEPSIRRASADFARKIAGI